MPVSSNAFFDWFWRPHLTYLHSLFCLPLSLKAKTEKKTRYTRVQEDSSKEASLFDIYKRILPLDVFIYRFGLSKITIKETIKGLRRATL